MTNEPEWTTTGMSAAARGRRQGKTGLSLLHALREAGVDDETLAEIAEAMFGPRSGPLEVPK